MTTRVLAQAGAAVAEIDLNPTRDDGTPGKLDGPATWSTGPEYTVVTSGDGLTASIFATGEVGAVTITVSGDGDLGSGVATISQAFGFEFVAPGEPLTTHLNGTVKTFLPAPDATPAATETPAA